MLQNQHHIYQNLIKIFFLPFFVIILFLLILRNIMDLKLTHKNFMDRTVSTSSKYTFIGDYRYDQDNLLGSGFESQVYKAQHRLKKHQVALKVVDVEKLGQGINKKLFEGELRCLQQLKSTPHVLNLHQVIRTQDKIYVVTELCLGDLSNRENKKLPREQAWIYLQQAIKGYRYLFEKQIVHRDLKPGNLFFNVKKEVKIGDFGFAAKLNQVRKQNYYNIGSPGYMAPETVKKNQYSFATDVWAFGIIYFELLTGKLPWTATTQQKINQQMTEQYLKRALIRPQIDELSKKFLQRVLCFNEFDRMRPQELLQYQLGQDSFADIPIHQILLNGKSHSKFDELSTTTAENTVKVNEKRNHKFMNNFFHQFSPPKTATNQINKKISLKTLIPLNSTKNQTLKAFKNQPKNHERRNSFGFCLETNFSFPTDTPKTSCLPGSFQNFSKKRKSFDSHNFNKKRENAEQIPKIKLQFFVKFQIDLLQKLFSLFEYLNLIGAEQSWNSEMHLMKVCLKNVMINIIVNNQNQGQYLNTIVGYLQTKRYMRTVQYENNKKMFIKFQNDFKSNSDLEKQWSKARQQNIDGAINSVLAFLVAIKPFLTDYKKNQLKVVILSCQIVEKLWQSIHLESFTQKQSEESITTNCRVIRRSQAFQKISEALLLKPVI